MTDDQLVPLALIAFELNCPLERLTKRFEGSIVLDDAGLRCVPSSVCREYLAEVRDKAAEVHRRQLALATESGARVDALRQRVRAIQDRQASLGEPLDGGALATMLAADREQSLDRAARQRQDLTSGRLTYHPIQEGN